LLSLKKSLGQSEAQPESPRTYLFDEVDTGVSGVTAEKVGRKLRDIAKGQQVICVTHLPQVAACGDVHFSISKSTQDGVVEMNVAELKAKSRIEEIARLISGEKITKTSLAHAEQLLSEV
jgi:DNA repair protein RecN (Recombination protein N)